MLFLFKKNTIFLVGDDGWGSGQNGWLSMAKVGDVMVRGKGFISFSEDKNFSSSLTYINYLV